MVYGQAWDETIPSDVRAASLGDDDIRALKIAIRERMETLVVDWEDEDPLRLLAAGSPISAGLIAARPNPPASINLLYYATDEDKLYISVAGSPDPTWTEVAAGSGGAAATQFDYGWFKYNADGASAVDRKVATGSVARVIPLYVLATTSSIGTVLIYLTDFETGLNTTKLAAVVATTLGSNGNRWVMTETSPDDPPDDYVSLKIFDAAGAAVVSTAVAIHVALFIRA